MRSTAVMVGGRKIKAFVQAAIGRALVSVAALSIVAATGCAASSPAHPSSPNLGFGCSTRIAGGRPLKTVSPQFVSVPGQPTAMIGLGGGWEATSISSAAGGGVSMFKFEGATNKLVRTIMLPSVRAAFGMAVTNDKQLLLVATYTATAVLSIPTLEMGTGNPIVGTLNDAQSGQFEVAVTQDDHYAFVAAETSGGLSVFDLFRARQSGFQAPGVSIGVVPLAYGAVGVSLSPDEKVVYVTTLGGAGSYGALWFIDAKRAERSATGVIGHVPAGCQPVRVALSPDGKIAWVSARQSNELLGFATETLMNHSSNALRAVVPVGSAPVGIVIVDDGRIALVGDSDRFETGSESKAQITVVNTVAAWRGQPATLGIIETGLFPRDISYDSTTDQVMVPNYASKTVELFPPPKTT